ncbi:MAG: nucleotidyltransferase domain-containing protein [Nanoarchaeota archaeon]|nr:nucleotidyltransferase domain-containing protein [Nanoarchaeota archaeon]
MELIKQTIKLGNSAGVILPKEWEDKKVRVELIDKSITESILETLIDEKLLKNVIGVYLTGSYARGEETAQSDIDILIVTDNKTKQIKKRKQEISFISKEKFEKNLSKNIFLLSQIKEAKIIINNEYIKQFKEMKLKISVKKFVKEKKNYMKNMKNIINSEDIVEDGIAYSLILRLRETYLAYHLLKERKYQNKRFKDLIKKQAGSLEIYDAYFRVKNNLREINKIKPLEANKINELIKIFVKKIEDGNK